MGFLRFLTSGSEERFFFLLLLLLLLLHALSGSCTAFLRHQVV